MTEQTMGDCNKLVELGRGLLPGQPHEIARVRDATVYLIRAAPTDTDFDSHEELDELVVVLDGVFRVEMPNAVAEVKTGESLLVRRGTPHRARLTTEAIILLIR